MEFDKSKVYTALNADESLIGAKGYFAEDLTTLQYLLVTGCEINPLTRITETRVYNDTDYSYFNFFYLVEPAPIKPKYRPFKDCDELISYFYQKHSILNTDWGLPFIWVKDKADGDKWLITEFFTNAVTIGSDNEVTRLEELFEHYTFLDGSVCGVEG